MSNQFLLRLQFFLNPGRWKLKQITKLWKCISLCQLTRTVQPVSIQQTTETAIRLRWVNVCNFFLFHLTLNQGKIVLKRSQSYKNWRGMSLHISPYQFIIHCSHTEYPFSTTQSSQGWMLGSIGSGILPGSVGLLTTQHNMLSTAPLNVKLLSFRRPTIYSLSWTSKLLKWHREQWTIPPPPHPSPHTHKLLNEQSSNGGI